MADLDPSVCRAEYQEALPKLDVMRDVLGGTEAMHAAATKYVMKWEREAAAIYEKRRVCETFFEGTKATLSAGVGMLFAKPVQVEWRQSESLKPVWDNLDNAGTAGPVLVKRFADAALRDGIAIYLTDHPSAPEGVTVTAANEAALGLRPTVALYSRRQAINWFVENVNNRATLTFLVLAESATKRSGFSIESVNRFRVLELVAVGREDGTIGHEARWTLYEEQKDTAGRVIGYRVESEGTFRNRAGQVADFLPVAIGYTDRTDAPLTSALPLLGVAWANIAHWRKSTDIEWYEKLCAFPQRVVVGRLAPDEFGKQPTELPSGPGHAIQLEAEGSCTWDELAGTSLAQLKASRDEKLAQMGAMGMAFMAPDTRVQETAEAKRLDSVAEKSTLATAGQGIQDATNMMLEHVAWFAGIPREGAPTIALTLDFSRKQMDAALLVAWATACEKVGLPVSTMLNAMVAGELLAPDTDVDQMASEMEVNKAASEDAARVMAEAFAPPAPQPLPAAA